ncbi:kinase-like domain-containing protein [Lophiotrema nucula]|uniref:non-specific serine/threonine protein kinase n=1 Tax=Lophiotrema nucula TaxID=690887 RepID=A0A6A5YJZ5_9PLEO|nr:kinase-like domain-containing protein [Lophiotrema nucula]
MQCLVLRLFIMSPRHATFGNHIVVESPKPSAATLHPISGPKPSQLGNHGLAVRKYEETFPVEPRSPSRSLRQNSGHRWTSEWSVSEYYDREPRFFWFYSDRQKPGGTAYIPKSTEDIPSFNDAPLMSFGPLSSPGEASSTVNAYKCKSSLSETDYVAVKEVECVRPEEQEAALKELRLLEGLEHRHIVACVGGYYLEDRFHIVQYPVAKYNLVGFLLARSTYLQFQRGDLVREREHRARIGTYFSCLCNALVYLSTKGVKHRDVKPENILIDKDNSILLTDFDRSRTDLKTVARTEDVTACTVRYSCRQVCQGESRDIKSDVFSLGCVFLEMATVMLGKPVRELYESIGSFPRNGVCEFAYWESVVEGKIDTWITTLVECSRHMRDGRDALASTQAGGEYHEKVLDKDHLNMIKRMMSDDNDERPTLDEVQLAFADLADDCRACQISNSIPAIYSMRLVSLSSSSSAEPSRSTVVRASLSNRLSVEPLETSRVRDLPTIEERHTPTSDDSTPTKDKDAVASMLLQGAGGANRMQRTGSESKQRVVGLAESPSRVFPTTNENNGPSQDVSTSAPLPRNQLVDASRASSRERGVHRTRRWI